MPATPPSSELKPLFFCVSNECASSAPVVSQLRQRSGRAGAPADADSDARRGDSGSGQPDDAETARRPPSLCPPPRATASGGSGPAGFLMSRPRRMDADECDWPPSVLSVSVSVCDSFPFNFSTKEAVSLPTNAPSRPIRAGIISHTQSAHPHPCCIRCSSSCCCFRRALPFSSLRTSLSALVRSRAFTTFAGFSERAAVLREARSLPATRPPQPIAIKHTKHTQPHAAVCHRTAH